MCLSDPSHHIFLYFELKIFSRQLQLTYCFHLFHFVKLSIHMHHWTLPVIHSNAINHLLSVLTKMMQSSHMVKELWWLHRSSPFLVMSKLTLEHGLYWCHSRKEFWIKCSRWCRKGMASLHCVTHNGDKASLKTQADVLNVMTELFFTSILTIKFDTINAIALLIMELYILQ